MNEMPQGPRYKVRDRSKLDSKYPFAVDDTFRNRMADIFENEAEADAYAAERNRKWQEFVR